MPRNLRISVPDGLRALKPIPSFIVPNSNFPKGFPFYVLTPFTPVLGGLHTALDNLSGWPLCRTPNNKLCGCSVSEISPRVGRLITGHKVIDKGSLPSKVRTTSLHWKALLQPYWVGHTAQGYHAAPGVGGTEYNSPGSCSMLV